MGKLRATNNFYVMGDIHNHVDSAQSFLDSVKPERVIWLGDFTDSHGTGDGAYEMTKTAIWLKKTIIERPQDTFIMSNHDVAYRFPENEKLQNCGWSRQKQRAFDAYFDKSLWERFTIAHFEEWNGKLIAFSHAGLKDTFFPFQKFDLDHLRRIEKIAFANGHSSDYNPLLDHWGASPLWVRWQALPLFEGICQVVGHTTFQTPQIRAVAGKPEWNLCMDCAHTYYAVFKEKHAYAVDRHKGYEHLLNFEPNEPQKAAS